MAETQNLPRGRTPWAALAARKRLAAERHRVRASLFELEALEMDRLDALDAGERRWPDEIDSVVPVDDDDPDD